MSFSHCTSWISWISIGYPDIFNSEEQPPGSITRSRQTPSGQKNAPGARTWFRIPNIPPSRIDSLHLRSSHNILILTTETYPPLFLFLLIWDRWCGLEDDKPDAN